MLVSMAGELRRWTILNLARHRVRTPASAPFSRAVARNANAPYSGYHVGAAGLEDDGRVVEGCNVENASYGLALCAECAPVPALHASGGGRLLAVAVVAGRDVDDLQIG